MPFGTTAMVVTSQPMLFAGSIAIQTDVNTIGGISDYAVKTVYAELSPPPFSYSVIIYPQITSQTSTTYTSEISFKTFTVGTVTTVSVNEANKTLIGVSVRTTEMNTSTPLSNVGIYDLKVNIQRSAFNDQLSPYINIDYTNYGIPVPQDQVFVIVEGPAPTVNLVTAGSLTEYWS